MEDGAWRRGPFVALAALLTIALPAHARAAEVSTFAGSGAAGIADGPAKRATFLAPEGLAIAPNGDVYVADAAAQRIRRISRAGIVTTVAGSGAIDVSHLYVRGGFADGPTATARFDKPSAVALGDGGIVVADRGNHCLRLIRGGRVTTLAGRCRETGNADGASSDARFAQPLGVAFDSSGTLYVADYGNGIRKVAPDGTTSTLQLPVPWSKHVSTVTGVCVHEGRGKKLLFVATDDGVLVADLAAPENVTFYESGLPESQNDGNAMVDGWHYFGVPYAIAGISQHRFVYTDIATNAVRFVSDFLGGQAAGTQSDEQPFAAGAFRDGSGSVARFSEPMGLARRADGSFLIGDSGNRRIRLIRDVQLRHLAELDDLAADRSSYRIVYIGDSAIGYDQQWDESIAGILERKLRGNWAALGFPRPPRLYPIWLRGDLDAMTQYANEYLATGLADMVILQFNSGEVYPLVEQEQPANLADDASAWRPMVTRDVRSMAQTLSKNHVAFAVSINPLSFEVSPVESTYYLNTVASPSPMGDYARLAELYRNAISAAGVTPIDLFAAFSAQELLPEHPALFGTRDTHLSVQGAALAAEVMYERLAVTKPWLHAPGRR